MKEKGIATAVMAAAIVVILVVAGVGAYFLTKPGVEEGAPTAEGGVSLNAPASTTENSTVLSWSQSTEADFVSYAIYRSTSSGTLGNKIITITDNSTISFTVTGLSPNTAYYFTIRVNRVGGVYRDSNQVSATTSSTIPPGITNISVYKGFWEPSGVLVYEALRDDVQRLRQDGINTLSFGILYSIGLDDNISLETGGPPWFQGTKEDWIALIDEAHANGFAVFLTVNTQVPDAPESPTDLDKFIQNINPVILEWAEIAERHHVELFAPLNEPDCVFEGVDSDETLEARAYSWGQDILPELRARYSGKLVFRVMDGFPASANFSGYDLIGFDSFPETGLNGWRQYIRGKIETALSLAARDGCENVILAEFGAITESIPLLQIQVVDENTQAEIYQITFEEGWGKLKGFFTLSWTMQGVGFKDKPVEQVVKEWYTE